jgi:hypothetical protein
MPLHPRDLTQRLAMRHTPTGNAAGRKACWLAAIGVLMPFAAGAQVGHPPEHSPYFDLAAKQSASLIGGFIGGSRGRAGVGPANGALIGIRYDHAIGAPVDIIVGLYGARLQRYVVNPNLGVLLRTSGPINQDLVMMETGLSLVLPGRKTWHGFAPYVGGTVGVAFETALAEDPSGYSFGTKGVFAPHAGLKWYPVQAFAIKIEARDYFWRLSYPAQFSIPPAGTTLPPVLTDANPEWTMHPSVLVSVGYTFTL